MSRFGGIYKDENVVCSTTCDIYVPSSVPDSCSLAVKCELHSFGHCDVYLIQAAGETDTASGSILDIPGQNKIRMDLDLNNILEDNLHYTTKDQYWHEFSRRYGPIERCVTVHFCKEDEHCDKFLELLQVSFRTLEECKRRRIYPENTYRLVAYETTRKISVAETPTMRETNFELPWERVGVIDIDFETFKTPLEEEQAIFIHIVPQNSKQKASISKDESQGPSSAILDRIQSSDMMKRYLHCQKCSESFDQENRHPRLLPCLHTMCIQCLKRTTLHNKVQCSACDVSYDVFNMDRDFPRDDARFDFIEYCQLKDENYNLYCNVCPGKVATHRCTRCAEWLCFECHDAHKRVTATKKHTLLSTDDMKLARTLEGFKRNVKCKRHSENCATLYCATECCQQSMCSTCALEKCEGQDVHKTKPIENISEEKREKIIALKDRVKSVGRAVTDAMEQIQTERKKIENTADCVAESIDSKFDSLIQLIEKYKDELKTDLRKSVNMKLDVLEMQKQELVTLKKHIMEAEELVDLVISSPNSFAVIQMEQTIINRLDKLANEVFDQSPRELSTFGFYVDDLEPKLEQVIADNAQIWSSSIFPDNCMTILDEAYWEDDSVKFTVLPQDYRGIPIKTDSVVMTATIENPEGSTTNGVVTPRPDEYSMVDVTADVVCFGRHILNIYMADTLVASVVFDRTRVKLRSTLPLGLAQRVISLDLGETNV